jgi:ABC-2 type transport system permease protein
MTDESASAIETFHPRRLPDVSEEARIFWRLRHRTVTNLLRVTLETNRLRLLLASLLTIILWGGLFVLFYMAFEFLDHAIPEDATHDETVRAVYSVFFGALTIMLVLSTAIILYSGLFRSDEARMLLTTPARSARIFLHKFQESMLFASWGFLLLASPMLVAYGLVAKAGWFYYAVLVPFVSAFVFIPGSIGAIVCLLVVRYVPIRRRPWLAVVLLAAVVPLLWTLWLVATRPIDDVLTASWFLEMIGRLRSVEYRLLPNWWLSSGLLEAARADIRGEAGQAALRESALFLAVTVSNALLLHQLAIWCAGRLYRRAYGGLAGVGSGPRRLKLGAIDRLLSACLRPFGPRMRLLLLKDARIFRRDPVQWSQFLIFFGLLGLYFLNTRRLSYDTSYAGWINMISFLNVAVVGLILSTFTTRFIFPMISLEGRRFWIVGRLPVRREMILWSKFLFAILGTLVPCLILILLSDMMLGVPGMIIAVHVLVCVLLCTGLSGIAVGLGARMPNLREESPARIASGFGGTLNLVLSASYIVALVSVATVPCHFYLLATDPLGHAANLDPARQWTWVQIGLAGGVLLGLVATIYPLWVGRKAFVELEV